MKYRSSAKLHDMRPNTIIEPTTCVSLWLSLPLTTHVTMRTRNSSVKSHEEDFYFTIRQTYNSPIEPESRQ